MIIEDGQLGPSVLALLINSQNAEIRGSTIDGVFKIGTAYIPSREN
ncbi:hypothetical protein ACFYO1_11780 [Nocardia sp. NPDC006044]